MLEQIELVLRDVTSNSQITLYTNIYDNSLSRKWLAALNTLLAEDYHLEKNYCFFGFPEQARNGTFICDQINNSIQAINQAGLGYTIDDYFCMSNTITDQPQGHRTVGRNIIHEKFNRLHRYFEDLQGTSGNISNYYTKADAQTRWHIRQLNLLCHEFESWALSWRKQVEAPEWQRPSQLMCWINAPRFPLEVQDYELFGIDTINRELGGVYVGVNKAIGKHHWEVFNDEGRDSRINELTTTSLHNQTEAAGDFDIEWGRNPKNFAFQQQRLQEFRSWLIANNFDPDDPALTIGHPQIGQVDLLASFGTKEPGQIWQMLNKHLDVYKISTSTQQKEYNYHWTDADYQSKQVNKLRGHR